MKVVNLTCDLTPKWLSACVLHKELGLKFPVSCYSKYIVYRLLESHHYYWSPSRSCWLFNEIPF
jgi:hypothetical protein